MKYLVVLLLVLSQNSFAGTSQTEPNVRPVFDDLHQQIFRLVTSPPSADQIKKIEAIKHLLQLTGPLPLEQWDTHRILMITDPLMIQLLTEKKKDNLQYFVQLPRLHQLVIAADVQAIAQLTEQHSLDLEASDTGGRTAADILTILEVNRRIPAKAAFAIGKLLSSTDPREEVSAIMAEYVRSSSGRGARGGSRPGQGVSRRNTERLNRFRRSNTVAGG